MIAIGELVRITKVNSKRTLVLGFDPIYCIKEIHFDPLARKNEFNILYTWIKMPLK